MEIVDSEEPVPEDFFFDHKVAKVALGKSPARIAGAVCHERFLVFRKLALRDAHMGAVLLEEIAVACQARGDNAIEHIHAGRNGVYNIVRIADAHEVSWFFFGKERRCELYNALNIFL